MTKSTISPVYNRVSETVRYFKTNNLCIREEGRYGPKLAHKAVMRAAKNLGMLYHHIDSEVVKVSHVSQLDIRKDVREGIIAQVARYLDNDFYREDLFCLISPDCFRDAMRDNLVDLEYGNQVRVQEKFAINRDGQLHRRIADIPCFIDRQVSGYIVLANPYGRR